MQKSFLIFASALVALMAGALFYAAKLPMQALEEPVDSYDPNAPVDAVKTIGGPVIVDFKLPDLDGVEHDFAEWKGKHRLINFWATWCAPCRREIPLLKTFQDEHGADGFQVIGVAVEWPDPVIAYAEDAKFNYPILVGEQEAMAVAETSGIQFIGLPFTMVVARDGELVGTRMGEIHQQHLDEIVSVLTRLDRGEIDKESVRAMLINL